MARYIDADIAIYEIDKLQGSLMSSNDALWKKNKMIYKGLCNARGIIDDIPTADVVPKSEVEMLQGALKAEERHNELTMEMAKKALANAKAEVAREIFEEIEKTIRAALILIDFSYKHNQKEMQCKKECYEDFLGYIAELKKKYTEE